MLGEILAHVTTILPPPLPFPAVLLQGRRKLLQCVLDVRDILNSSEPYYILNNLYITDYATWLQRARYCMWEYFSLAWGGEQFIS